MQVILNPETPAEIRFVTAFLNDLADFKEANPASRLGEPAPQVQAEPVKTRTRKAKDTPAVTEQTTTAEPVTQTADPVEPVTEPVADPAEPAATEQAEFDTDALRTLFGKLASAGRRDRAVKIVRSYGFNGIAEIDDSKRNEIGQKLTDLLNEEE